MRKLAAIVIGLMVVVVPAVDARDESPGDECFSSFAGPVAYPGSTTTTVAPNSIVCRGARSAGNSTTNQTKNVSTQTTPRPAGTSSGSTAPVKKYVPYNRLSTGPDGQPCAATGYVEEGTTPPDERLLADPNPRDSNIPIYGSDFRILENYPPCPEVPRAPGEPAPVETAAMVAARYWEQIPLPKPAPKIAPGRAITGKLAYLETNGEITHTYTNSTVFGPLQIVAKGSYTVDWGDGETSYSYSVEGKPWPDGEITHQYIKIGAYDVVVTEKWTATWSLDGQSGVLRTLQTTGRIEDFPVEQIQAVIGR